MQYVLSEDGTRTLVRIAGTFTFAHVKLFREVLEKMEASERTEFVFDLAQLEFIDSSALGQLLIAHEEAQRQGWRITLSGAQGIVRRSLESASFERFFEIA